MNLVTELHAVCAALARAQIRYAICGGVAVTIHGATRSTKDIDILIAPTDVDSALDAVRAIGYKFAALPLVFDEGTARERHVQRVSKIEDGEHLMVDFLLERSAFAGMHPAGHPPSGVIERMERLRVLCVPESDADARRRLADRPRTANAPFATTVARRLAELRALCDLASHLRRQ